MSAGTPASRSPATRHAGSQRPVPAAAPASALSSVAPLVVPQSFVASRPACHPPRPEPSAATPRPCRSPAAAAVDPAAAARGAHVPRLGLRPGSAPPRAAEPARAQLVGGDTARAAQTGPAARAARSRGPARFPRSALSRAALGRAAPCATRALRRRAARARARGRDAVAGAGSRPSAEQVISELEGMRPLLADGKAADRLPAAARGPARCAVT